MNFKTTYVLVLLFVCFTLLTSNASNALPDVDGTKVVEPPVDGPVRIGFGYNSKTGQFKPRRCLEAIDGHNLHQVLKNLIQTRATGGSGSDLVLNEVDSYSDLAKEMNLSIRASASYGTRVSGKYSASYKLGIIDKTKVNKRTYTLAATYNSQSKPKMVELDHLRLHKDYLDMLGDPRKIDQFREECGDYFVWGIRDARELYATVYLDDIEIDTERNVKHNATFNFKKLFSRVGAGADVEKDFYNQLGTTELKMVIYSTDLGEMYSPTNISEFRDYIYNFSTTSKNEEPVDIHLISYEKLKNFPFRSSIEPETDEIKLETIVLKLWDLRSLIEAAQSILENEDKYALGIGSQKRKQGKDYVKNLKKNWETQLRDLQEITKKCLDNFSEACNETHKVIKDYSYSTEYEKLPVFYSVDCSMPHKVSGNPGEESDDKSVEQLFIEKTNDKYATSDPRSDPIGEKMTFPVDSFNPIDGSNDKWSRGHVKTRVWYSLIPDKTKGEKPTKLRAKIAISMDEWRLDNNGNRILKPRALTQFTGTSIVDVYDLDPKGANPGKYQLPVGIDEDRSTECEFAWFDGIKPRAIVPDDETRIPAPIKSFLRENLKNGQYLVHGFISQISNLDSPVHTLYPDQDGLLESITCRINTQGDERFHISNGEKNNLYCYDPEFVDFSIDLINTLDKERESKPYPPVVYTIDGHNLGALRAKVNNTYDEWVVESYLKYRDQQESGESIPGTWELYRNLNIGGQ